MFRKSLVVVMFLVIGVALAQAAFTTPNGDQIKQAAGEPEKIKTLLTDATVEQASSVLLSVVRQVQQLDVKPEVKRERIGKLFAAVQEVMGKNAGPVIADVAKRIDADLLPPVAALGTGAAQPANPIALPLAPPIKPGPPPPPVTTTYAGQ